MNNQGENIWHAVSSGDENLNGETEEIKAPISSEDAMMQR